MKTFLSIAIGNCFLFFANLSFAQQWQHITEIPAAQMTALFSIGDTLFVAGDNKLYFTYDNGQNWDSTAVINPSVDFIEAVHYEKGHLFVGTVVDGVFRSDNGGLSWQPDNAGLAGLGALSISCLESRGDSLYVGTYGAGIFVKKISTNSNWGSYNIGLPWYNVESITNIDGKLFAGAGANATVSVQPYPGNTWSELPFDNFNGAINAFLGVVRHGDVLLAAGSQRIYRSADNGETWTSYNPGTGLLGAAKLVILDTRVIANLAKIVGLSFIQYTNNQGVSWNNFEPAIAGSYGYDLAVMNGQIYSARDNGLWRIETQTAVEEPTDSRPLLGQNFPNPFSVSTTIPVKLPRGGRASLSIFNSMGVLVENIWCGETQLPGNYEVNFQAGALPSGTYFCKLVTQDDIFVQKVTLIQ